MKPTSKMAFESISESHKKAMWARIMKCLQNNPAGLTADQLAAKLRVDHVQISRRMGELRKAGIVIDTPILRKTRSGRSAMVRQLGKKYAA